MERRAAERAAVPQSALNRAVGLVLLAAISPQVGAAFAVEVFDELGPAGAAFGRLAFAAVILVALWRPRIKDQPIGVAVAFGLALGAMAGHHAWTGPELFPVSGSHGVNVGDLPVMAGWAAGVYSCWRLWPGREG